MQGTIDVAAYMEAQERARRDQERFLDRQRKLAIGNALWAYHRAEDKQQVVELFKVEFEWLKSEISCPIDVRH